MSTELYIERERLQYNPQNGQFLKGHKTFNKGKKWEDYMPKRTANRLRKFIREKLPHTGNPNLTGWNARPIFCLDDEGNTLGWFASAMDAGRKTGICARNINSVLHGKRKHAGGYRWIYDNNSKKNK